MNSIIDPLDRVRAKVEEQLFLLKGKRTRIGSDAARLAGSIRDEMLARVFGHDALAATELRLVLKESLVALEELEKATA